MAEPLLVKKKKKSPASTALLIGSFVLVFVILFDVGGLHLRQRLGDVAGLALNPLLTFQGNYPVLTILLASTLLVVSTTVIRHFLTDWVNMARVQDAMRAFQREFADARKSNNTYKMKKLTEAQPKIMELQAEMQTESMKPMAYTMLLVIPIFAWLAGLFTVAAAGQVAGLFVANGHHVIKVPWDSAWDLTLNTNPPDHHWYLLGFLPRWIVLYSLFGIPLGALAQRALKLWEYRHHHLTPGPIVLKD